MTLKLRLFSKHSKKEDSKAPPPPLPPHSLLESFPPELILEIFDLLPSFGDLNALISASPACLRVFNEYTSFTLNRMARRIVGLAAWADKIVVLTCQRHSHPVADPAKLIGDLTTKFNFNRKDIPGFVSNERAYAVCAKQFRKAWDTKPSYLDIPFVFRGVNGVAPPIHISLRRTPGFPREGVLPRKIFYRIWVYCVASRFENVGFPLEFMSYQQRLELRLMQYIMKPRKVRKAINYELTVGFRGRRNPVLKRIAAAAKPAADRAWETLCDVPKELFEELRMFKAESIQLLWIFIDNL